MATSSDNYINYLGQSAAWAIPELFGIDAPPAVQQWRADNPVGGFASSFAGSTIPYIGWYKWGARALKMEEMLAGLANSKKLGAIGGGALSEAARFMPLEAGRIFGNQAFGSHDLGEMISSAAINEALAGTAGAFGGIVKTMGTRKKLPEEIIPGVDSTKPPQLQLRGIQTDFGNIPLPDQPAAYGRMDNLRVAVRSEDAPYEHIGVMTGKNGTTLPERKRAELNRIFDTRRLNKGDVRARKFLADPKHFKDDVSWMNQLGEFGIQPGGKFEEAVQFPRFVQGINPAGQLRAKTLFDDFLERIDTDTYMGREADDGLFVMAKKSQKNPDDWLLFKTDQPDYFNQSTAQFGNVVVEENAWARQDPNLYRSGGTIDDAYNDLQRRMPLQNYRFGLKTAADGSVMKAGSWGFDKASDLMGFSGVRKTIQDSEAVASVKRFFNQHFTPGMYQFKGRVRANYIDGMMRAAVDMGKAHANKLLYGEAALDPGKGLIWQTQTYANKKAGGVMDKILYDLKDEEVKQIWDIWRNEISQKNLITMKQQGKLTDKAYDVANEMHTIARQLDSDSVAQKHKYGGGAFRPRDDHMMIAKQWNGDQLLEIRDKRNALVGLASGNSAKQVENEAARIIKEQPPGEGWRTGASFRYSSGANLPADVKSVRDRGIPGHFLGGTRVKGHRWSTDDEPWTRKEMAQEFASAVHARAQQQVSLTLENTMASDLDKLAMDDIDAFGNITTRMADLRGEQRPMAQWINQQADQILAPLLGRNSANKIVEVTNKAMWHLELGGLRIGYTLLNALTPIQTVVPHIAMLLNADQAMLGDYYTHFAAMGTKGPVGTVGFLSPWKVMKESLKAMRKPDQQELEMYQWAMNNGVISPRIVEEFIGGNATAIQQLGSSFKSPGSFGEKFIPFLGKLSEFLPSASEKFSRGFSFMAGIKTGRLMGITDTGDLQQFAKRFTERTNYLYGQADRAGIMTGPVGGTLGLFKNWMMHYVGNMAEYAGEGMYRNNWTPLLWQQATTLGIGGLAATPLYPIAQTFNDWASNKPLMENIYESMDKEAADDLMYGLPATLGFSLTSQASSPFSNPARDAGMFFSIVHADRMKFFAQAAGAAWDNWQLTGSHPGESQEVMRALTRAVMPKALYKTISSVMDDTVESWTTGYPVTGKKESLLDRSLSALGFTPVDIERTYAAADILYKDAEYRRAMVGAAGKAYLEAQKAGDSQAMWEVIQGAKNAGLSLSSVFKSAATRNRAGQQDMIDRTFSPAAKQRVKAMLQD